MSVEASGGGASVGTDDRSGDNNVGDECIIVIDQINEGSSDQRFSEQEKKPPPKIQKVPETLLRHNHKLKKYFEPKMFSFGPYNRRRRPRTHKMAEQIKANLAMDFLQQNGVKKEDLYENIKIQIKDLMDCYHDNLTKNNKDTEEELAWMFLVDGCAILQFMYIYVDFQPDQELQFKNNLGIKTDHAEFLVHDLFLLENQLPYQLLQLIIQHATLINPYTKEDEFRNTSKEEELLESIYKFIFSILRQTERWSKYKGEILQDLKDDHVHLLHLLREKLILHQIDEKRDFIEIIIGWIVVLCDKLKCNRNEFYQDRFPIPFRNIGKLREDGINLKRSKKGDISFSCGTLKVPPIILVESTTTMFPNMLGYEMCPDFDNEFEASTYMYFLYKLIVQTQDVKELREKNILLNQLGSDEEVVELFNEISTYLSPDMNRYKEVKSNIDNYFDNKGLIWLHKVSHDIHQYFKGRWSVLALIGAFLAVISSIFQAVITFLAYQADSKKGV